MLTKRLIAVFGIILLVAVGCSSGSDDTGGERAVEDQTPNAVAVQGEGQNPTPNPNDVGTETVSGLTRLIVGEDIKPGINIATDLGTCYYARLATADGGTDDAIGQANALGSQVFVEIEPTDVSMLTISCGTWRPPTDAELAPTPDGGIPDDGMWLIPEHITPGTYETVATDLPVGCFYQTLDDLSASLPSFLDTEQGLSGQATMTIGEGVRAVRAYRCGEWKKVS